MLAAVTRTSAANMQSTAATGAAHVARFGRRSIITPIKGSIGASYGCRCRQRASHAIGGSRATKRPH
jgi:hypothetical protein